MGASVAWTREYRLRAWSGIRFRHATLCCGSALLERVEVLAHRGLLLHLLVDILFLDSTTIINILLLLPPVRYQRYVLR